MGPSTSSKGSNSYVPPSAKRERNRWPSLRRYDLTLGKSRTTRSYSESGGHIARVVAIGPNSSLPGSSDFQVPLPRLQSILTATRPSVRKVSVYFVGSSGLYVVLSPYEIFVSFQDVPTSGDASVLAASAVGFSLSPSCARAEKVSVAVISDITVRRWGFIRMRLLPLCSCVSITLPAS